MFVKAKVIAMAVLLVPAYGSLALGQAPPTILVIKVENLVEYRQDNPDPSKFATNLNITPPTGTTKNFGVVTLIGDIVAVNGQPAKGTYVGRTRRISSTPNPNPGEAIADVTRTAIREVIFEILKSDGTPVGTIVGLGFSGGPPPPGATSAHTGGSWAIVGGTGAFLGARGQLGEAPIPRTPAARAASITEDPANRRINGGGSEPWVLTVIPMSVPQIVTAASGPSVAHSGDFSIVTGTKPAAAGEILSIFATGLGPTVPGVDPGKPFPASPPAVVNSPVEVTVNGVQAEVLAAVGFPGTVDGYQVNFRLPTDAAKGPATIQLSAAWIAGPEVKIVIQ